MPASPLDILAEELGTVAGRIEREAALRLDAALADLRRVDAERELRLQNLERTVERALANIDFDEAINRAIEAIPRPQSGDPGRPPTADEIADAVAKYLLTNPPKPGAPGTSVTIEHVAPLVDAAVRNAVSSIPVLQGEPGINATDDQVSSAVEAYLKANPPKAGQSITLSDVAPMIADAVRRAVDAIPAPQNGVGMAGAFVDRHGHLIVTLSNGTTHDLGQVVGTDGKTVSTEAIAELIRAEVAKAVEHVKALGPSVDPGLVPALVDKAVSDAIAKLPPPCEGKPSTSVSLSDVAPMVEQAVSERVARAIAALPEPKVVDVSGFASAAAVERLSERIDGCVVKIAETSLDHRERIEAFSAKLPSLAREAIAAMIPAEPTPPAASVTVEDIKPLIEDAVAKSIDALPKPNPIRGVTVADMEPLVVKLVRDAVSALPPAEPGAPGAPGLLPLVKGYEDRVYYAGEVVAHIGATFQATKDTGHAPPHEDWICIAAAGKAARCPRVRETYDPNAKDYSELDIVALNGAAFIARRDDPGPCPGAGWQMIAMQGKQGKRGDGVKGDPGDPGSPGPRVERLEIDSEGLLTLFNADGSTVECDLYPVLAKVK